MADRIGLRRAHAGLTRARFTDPDVAADVLRQVQVLTMTAALARLDYARPDDAHAAIGNLITSPAARGPQPGIVPVPLRAHPAAEALPALQRLGRARGAAAADARAAVAPALISGSAPRSFTAARPWSSGT